MIITSINFSSMDYCSNCIIPVSRPDQSFTEKKICNACESFQNREKIDWNKRWEFFLEKIDKIKKKKMMAGIVLFPLVVVKIAHIKL